ncbi:ATP-NAD kinase family protein [Porticoccus litoralis]|uniref:ATP-NAD kinase family protein n=1 Tax=Porticoccus litoralis TaxID=434086 RepID=A0AAW8B2T9_9GAMM|nr:ATP-NAD kinase family protein [Porticoccus litoralis]MDP1519845.1 ATP-NAD kinase family protein [Porticoccus litoralis]TNE93327.1 MAG: ATP-NAD kinase [Gammaproteobacteria bacterium]
MFRLGLIINPLAGLGGPAGLKGSDGRETAREAIRRGSEPRAPQRALRALRMIAETLNLETIQLLTGPGSMGEIVARECGFKPQVVGEVHSGETTPEDTEQVAAAMVSAGVDLLLFVGGDGTARNICNAVPAQQPVLGVPAGVKMQSGVYAITPEAAGELVGLLVRGQLVDIRPQEVRDIDEQALREGRVKSRYYGELLVPGAGQFMQQVKSGGREVESLVLKDIADTLLEEMADDCLYIIGPGSTTAALMEEMSIANTLLGVDLIRNRQLLAADVSAGDIERALQVHQGPVKIVITPIGGQGILLGRGNQQLTPDILKRVGRDNLLVVATKTKITELGGRPLLVDSNDPQLDQSLAGYLPVLTGYRDRILYPVGLAAC